jgi:hypothetical protein
VRIGQRVRAVHLSQYCPGGLGFPAGSPGNPGCAASSELAATGPGPDAAGANCSRCAGQISAGQPARRRRTGDWVHEDCPAHSLLHV